MVEKLHAYGIKNVFTSGLVFVITIGSPVPERAHEMIEHLCNKLAMRCVGNRNNETKQLWKDGLHLV